MAICEVCGTEPADEYTVTVDDPDGGDPIVKRKAWVCKVCMEKKEGE